LLLFLEHALHLPRPQLHLKVNASPRPLSCSGATSKLHCSEVLEKRRQREADKGSHPHPLPPTIGSAHREAEHLSAQDDLIKGACVLYKHDYMIGPTMRRPRVVVASLVFTLIETFQNAVTGQKKTQIPYVIAPPRPVLPALCRQATEPCGQDHRSRRWMRVPQC
jgi:hypothetical protein